MQEILEILERDARIDPALIAAQLGVPEDLVSERIAQWERDGVIRRYRTVIDWERAGRDAVCAFIDVSVTPERGAGFDVVAERIARFPEVRSVFLVSGGHDLRVVVEGTTMREVANFVAEKLATLDRVTATATHFLLKCYKDNGDLFVDLDDDHRMMVAP